MPTTERTILVDAAIKDVFEFVADYRNTTRYQQQFSRFEPVGPPTSGVGMTVDARGRFKGFPIHSKLRITEFIENERIVARSVGGLKSAAEWHFAWENGQTRVRFVAKFDWPVPFLGRTLRRMLESEIEAMTEASLRRLKLLVESRNGKPINDT